ncbi:MAG: glycerol-3-phosphate 1-O-acyltransferase PlsY [Eggerthellaceae bacterium]|nr:glycerol-3-phosphate 1-O-acyltransferase PlsY [Eggerthellaceae bacterium]
MLTALGLLCLLFAVTFLLGSVPWGVVISRLVYHKDIRDEGSGNIGTTNAMRALGKKGGAAVFVLDFGKGLLSGALALAAAAFLASDNAATGLPHVTPLLMMAGLDKADAVTSAAHLARAVSMAVAFAGCTWGHIFSPWLGFKGGKGIAVAVGALFFVFSPAGALLEIALFAVIVLATRYVSAGSLAAAVACPFFALYYYWGDWPCWAIITAVALTVVWAHRGNIDRLRHGTERRIGAKKAQAAEEGARS